MIIFVSGAHHFHKYIWWHYFAQLKFWWHSISLFGTYLLQIFLYLIEKLWLKFLAWCHAVQQRWKIQAVLKKSKLNSSQLILHQHLTFDVCNIWNFNLKFLYFHIFGCYYSQNTIIPRLTLINRPTNTISLNVTLIRYNL